jgi:hypothetical protein
MQKWAKRKELVGQESNCGGGLKETEIAPENLATI